MKKRNLIIKFCCLALILAIVSIVEPTLLEAQCPMCRMSAESNLAAGGEAGKSLNTGILYILSLPYLMVGFLGFVWWRNRTDIDDLDTAQ